MPEQPQINFQEKRDIGQVLNATFAFVRLTYKYIYKDLLIMAAPFFILNGLLSALQQIGAYSMINSPGVRTYMFFTPSFYLSLLCLLTGWIMAFTIVGNYVLQYKINGNTDFNVPVVRKAVMKDFFRLLFVYLLFYLAIALGLVLIIIPGLYFAIAFSLCSTITIQNKQSGLMDTFSESRRLINNNWWRTLGLSIIVSIIMYAFSFVFNIPNIIYTFIFALHATQGGSEKYRLPLIIFSSFAQLAYCLTAPISVVSFALYYYSLKEEKDEPELLKKIDEFGGKENAILVNEKSF
jgi:hypothetical protein